jgi:uncharacterized membrane protein
VEVVSGRRTIGAEVLLGVAMLGAALVAALVASLAGAWGISEVFDWAHTVNERPSRRTAKLYVTYALAHVLGAVIVLMSPDLVSLVIDVEVMNALLLPIVLGFGLYMVPAPLGWMCPAFGKRRPPCRFRGCKGLALPLPVPCSENDARGDYGGEVGSRRCFSKLPGRSADGVHGMAGDTRRLLPETQRAQPEDGRR